MADEHLSKEFKKKIFELSCAVYRVTALFDEYEPLAVSIRKEASEILRCVACYDVLPQNQTDELILTLGKIRAIRNLLLLARVNNFAAPVNFDVLDREYRKIESFFSSKIEFLQINNAGKSPMPVKEGNKINNIDDSVKISKNKQSVIDNFFSTANSVKGSALGAEHSVFSSSEQDVYLYKFDSLQHQALKKSAVINKIDKTSDTQNLTYKKNTDLNLSLNKNENKLSSHNNERQKLIVDFLSKNNDIGIKDISMSFNNVSAKTIQRDLNELIKKHEVVRNGERRWAVYSLVKATQTT